MKCKQFAITNVSLGANKCVLGGGQNRKEKIRVPLTPTPPPVL